MAQAGTVTPSRETSKESGEKSNDGSELQTDRGSTSVADSVVAKIAGIAAREISGVHDMGMGAARVFGALKEKLPVGGNAPNPTQGVSVEVGEKETAVDLDLVIEYGVSIPDLSRSVRNNVIHRVERMTGLAVTEVNISIDDVWLGDDEDDEGPQRVQ